MTQAESATDPGTAGGPGVVLDPIHPANVECPFPLYRQLRASAPVAYIESHDFYMVSTYESCLEVLRNPATFRQWDGDEMFEAGQGPPLGRPSNWSPEVRAAMEGAYRPVSTLVNANPPRHTRYRKLATSLFSARRTAGAMDGRMHEIVHALIDGFPASGEVDFVAAIAVPFPIKVISEILGFPAGEYQTFKRWTDSAMVAIAGGVETERLVRAVRDLTEFQRYLLGIIEQRRSEPADDVVGHLANATVPDVEGSRLLTPEETIGVGLHLLTGGAETTTNLLGSLLHRITTTPGLLDQVRTDPAVVPTVIEETLRMDSPFQALFRRTTEAVTLAGVDIPAGAKVLVSFGSANRDERQFDRSEEFRPERGGSHIAFGFGTHFCLGAPLARSEALIATQAIVGRLAGLRAKPVARSSSMSTPSSADCAGSTSSTTRCGRGPRTEKGQHDHVPPCVSTYLRQGHVRPLTCRCSLLALCSSLTSTFRRRVRGLAVPDNLTLGHIVRRNAEQFPSRTAMICRDRAYSWAEYDVLVNRAANALTALGVAFGDHVAALGWNSVEYFQIYHGAAKIGAVFGTVNWRLAPPEISFIVTDGEPKVLLVEAGLQDKVTPLLADLAGVRIVVYGIGDYDLTSLRVVLTAAAKYTREFAAAALDALSLDRLLFAYGLTEASALVSITEYNGQMLNHENTIGFPVWYDDVRIVDDQDADVKPGTIGELIVRGPNLFKGYHKLPEANASIFRNGWLHTGDLVFKQDGFLFFADRVKDMVKTGGLNVYSSEVELGLLKANPELAEISVIGVPDDTWGEAVVAIAVLGAGRQVSQEQIIERSREHLAGYKLPKRVYFFDELPKNVSGKVQKTRLREVVAEIRKTEADEPAVL